MSTDVISGTVSKKADRYAIDVLGIPSLTLMETASSKVAEHIISNFPTSSVLVLSGTGNNGADGICIARLLCENTAFTGTLQAVVAGNLEHASWEFLHQLAQYKSIGGKINLYGATPHVFRHSYITTLAKADVDLKTIQRISGHANISTTLNIYTHTREEEIQHAGAKIGKLLGA